MSGPASRKYSTSKRVLKLLEPINLDIWIERITIVKFRMDNGGGVAMEIEIWTDTTKFTNTYSN